jgi:hypothetical protein
MALGDKERYMKKLWGWMVITSVILVTILVLSSVPGQAGDYPDKPVMIISDSAPGAADC